jgi:hypothetical protein
METITLQHYRVYTLDHAGHVDRPAIERSFETEEEAIEFARAKLDSHVLELWQENRLVCRLSPGSDEPAWPT